MFDMLPDVDLLEVLVVMFELVKIDLFDMLLGVDLLKVLVVMCELVFEVDDWQADELGKS